MDSFELVDDLLTFVDGDRDVSVTRGLEDLEVFIGGRDSCAQVGVGSFVHFVYGKAIVLVDGESYSGREVAEQASDSGNDFVSEILRNELAG